MALQGLLVQLEPRPAARHEPPTGDGGKRRQSRGGERQEGQRLGFHALERVFGGYRGRGRGRTKVVRGRLFIVGYWWRVVVKPLLGYAVFAELFSGYIGLL